MFQANPTRPPRLILVPVRVLLITLLLALLSLAVSLLIGIVGIVVVARMRGVEPNMTLAYRHVAVPTAAVIGAIALVTAVVVEVRTYRRNKALAEIERAA